MQGLRLVKVPVGPVRPPPVPKPLLRRPPMIRHLQHHLLDEHKLMLLFKSTREEEEKQEDGPWREFKRKQVTDSRVPVYYQVQKERREEKWLQRLREQSLQRIEEFRRFGLVEGIRGGV